MACSELRLRLSFFQDRGVYSEIVRLERSKNPVSDSLLIRRGSKRPRMRDPFPSKVKTQFPQIFTSLLVVKESNGRKTEIATCSDTLAEVKVAELVGKHAYASQRNSI